MILQYYSGLKEDSCELSVNEIFSVALRLAGRCLNGKRIEILRMIAEQDGARTITSTVDHISEELGCPKSTVWINVNMLKELGLIENGRGNPVRVTKVGEILLRQIEDDKGKGKFAEKAITKGAGV
jgi:DNA-binding MarR family transcriptional regulator